MTEVADAVVNHSAIVRERIPTPYSLVVEKELKPLTRVWNRDWVRQLAFLFILAVFWESYARYLDDPLIFPSLSETFTSLGQNIINGALPGHVGNTLKVLLTGYGLGVLFACLFTSLAVSSRFCRDGLTVLTSMFNPLPAVSLLPIALLWFGMGWGSLVFVIIHAVLWPMALSVNTGFQSISPTIKMVGQNCGLSGFNYVLKILLPAALPSIIAGLKMGWAFAWRTLIASEMIFGVSSGNGGLGWFIFVNRNLMDTQAVFAGLLMVIIIGLVVENLVFRSIEAATVRRWGMVRG